MLNHGCSAVRVSLLSALLFHKLGNPALFCGSVGIDLRGDLVIKSERRKLARFPVQFIDFFIKSRRNYIEDQYLSLWTSWGYSCCSICLPSISTKTKKLQLNILLSWNESFIFFVLQRKYVDCRDSKFHGSSLLGFFLWKCRLRSEWIFFWKKWASHDGFYFYFYHECKNQNSISFHGQPLINDTVMLTSWISKWKYWQT